MCRECGCEAVPVIKSLVADHVGLAARVRRITQTLDERRDSAIAVLAEEFTSIFDHHSAVEDVGLFAQLRETGIESGEVKHLLQERRRLRAELSAAEIAGQPQRLRAVLAEVVAFGQEEIEELYPAALRKLPTDRWGEIEDQHQLMLTR
jgi:hypothetical protein